MRSRCAIRCWVALSLITIGANAQEAGQEPAFSPQELAILRSLALRDSDLVPRADPSNRFQLDERAQKLGKTIFFDERFSRNGEFSCATCHDPDRAFTDGLPRGKGLGVAMRNTPTLLGASHATWFYWDGRRDSLWSQALLPFEAADEMGLPRTEVLRIIRDDLQLGGSYVAIFGPMSEAADAIQRDEPAGPYGGKEERDRWRKLPLESRKQINRDFANVGKAVAAYEGTLMPERTRFDSFVAELDDPESQAQLSSDEISGLRIFIDENKSRCLRCHNGPMFTNGGFHNIGTGVFSGAQMDFGRVFGLRAVLMDEFNCVGPYSDSGPDDCLELRFLNADEHVPLDGAFKVPTLRGIARTAPYFHDGRFETLSDVLAHYREPPKDSRFAHELLPIQLTDQELLQLVRFLESL